MKISDAADACAEAAAVLGIPAADLTARPINGGWRVSSPTAAGKVGGTSIALRSRDAARIRVSHATSDDEAANLLAQAPAPQAKSPAPKVLPANAIALGILIQAIVLIGSLFLPQPFKALGVGAAASISVATARASMRRKRAVAADAR